MKRIVTWCIIGLAAAALVAYLAWPRPLQVETARCSRGAIAVAITEEAKTRLDSERIVSMPVLGRLQRIDLEVGDVVRKDQVIARVETFDRLQTLAGLEDSIRSLRASIVGVDKAKPKPEDFQAQTLAVEEAKTRQAASQKALEEARVNYDEEEKQYLRTKRLFDEHTVSQSDLDVEQRKYLTLKASLAQAQLNAEVAAKAAEQEEVKLKRLHATVDDNEYQRTAYQAQIHAVEAEIAVSQDEVARSEVRAPVAGPIVEKHREGPQFLSPGEPLVTIGDLTTLRVEADILSEDVGRLSVGQAVEVAGQAVGDKALPARIERIYPAGFKKISSLGIEQQRVKVIAAFDQPPAGLRPGVRVDVRIVTDRRENVLLVTDRALFKVRDAWHVFAVRQGRAHLTPVTVGLRNDEQAEIADGLREGDLVIPSPPSDLADGVRVAPGSD